MRSVITDDPAASGFFSPGGRSVQAIEFDVDINSTDYLTRYRSLTDVRVMARNGQILRFPASSLQRFVTREGVQGSFRIRFDDHYKMIDLMRVE